jgi:hypothetical protein
LLYALDEYFEGEGRDGGIFLESNDPGLISMLCTLDAEEASKPVAGMSIADHVYHLVFALDIFIGRIGGDKNAIHADWSWIWQGSLLDDAAWTRLKKELSDLREKTVSLTRNDNLKETCEINRLRLIMGLLTHTVFHLGIIRVKFDAIKGLIATADGSGYPIK